MIENKFVRAAPDSPTRCQGPTAGGMGQCPFESQEGSEYCTRHQGSAQTQQKQRVSMYHLDQYNARVSELAGHGEVKSLRDEIGIARMVLEKIIVACKGDDNLIVLASPRISDLVTRIEKLVVSCNRLEASAGALLDKTAILQLASLIVGVISEYVEDQDALEAISERIIGAILEQKAFKKDEKPQAAEGVR